MSDLTKAQKLAAARKKLKQYQQKSHKPNEDEMETLSNLTHSSTNGHYDAVPLECSQHNQSSPFHNYFNGNPQNENVCAQEPSINFFDNYSSRASQNLEVNLECPELNIQPVMISEDVMSFDDPEIKQSDIYGFVNVADHLVTSEDAKKLSEYMGAQDSVNSTDSLVESVLNSNPESLRQLSSQINELIQDDVSSNLHTNELERRNRELAALLEQQRVKSQTFNVQLQDSQNMISQLELQLQQSRIDHEHRINRELGPLQEQLQCHAQTVGILVGEKTELATELSQSQLVAKQKISECEDLQGRLKASRSRVADLEKELQGFRSDLIKRQSHGSNLELEKIKKIYRELKEEKEEVSQDILELREKLNIRTNENVTLQRELQEVTHQFSLAQVKIGQITAGGSIQIESEIEMLTQHKLALEKQVLELSEALKVTGEQRDQASIQYQQYVQQLNAQFASLAGNLESVTAENESLANREQSLITHIGELEKHLQSLQEERLNFTTGGKNSTETKKELESALESIQTLQSDKNTLDENYQQVLNERVELLREVENKKEAIDELEGQLERLKTDRPDSAKLLAAMESDKVAAARAVAQNSELKQQLEEMQQAFVRMSNDKLELMDKLTSEEYQTHELLEKLRLIEQQLHTLTDAINIKDNELTQMRDTLGQQNKQILQQDQLTDRLRHYEAQHSSSQVLQQELQDLHDEILLLKKENVTLKADLKSIHNKREIKWETVDSNSIMLETNVNSSDNAVKSSDKEAKNSDEEVKNPGEEEKVKCPEQDEVKNLDLIILDKEKAMKHLEEKFTRTMSDIANLYEEKQRLEHIVTQLQGETETIGEYIALYQHQRGILQQRTQEKDDQLKRLAQDRDSVRTKLDVLNELVKKLVLEKGMLSPTFLEQHKHLSSQTQGLCLEHTKIQEKMNRIVDDNTQKTPANENNNLNVQTAEEIISLLAEIKGSNLIQPNDGLENFHPCSWCSGQLITV